MRAVVSETLALSILVTSRAWALQESYETYEGHVGLHLSRGTDEGERLTRWTPGETGTSLICEVTQWCDNQVCSDVCARGTVRVPWWIENAHRLQHRLSSTLPLCDASFFGGYLKLGRRLSLADSLTHSLVRLRARDTQLGHYTGRWLRKPGRAVRWTARVRRMARARDLTDNPDKRPVLLSHGSAQHGRAVGRN